MRTLAYQLATLAIAIANCKRSGNTEWYQRHMDALKQLVNNYMPSGSGWDCGTTMSVEDSSDVRLVFYGSWHHMNSNGYYTNWTGHTIVVRPTFTGMDIRVTGRNQSDIKTYLGELFYEALQQVTTPEDVCEMRLCEVPHLLLRPNQLYRFTVDSTCAGCVAAAKACV